ncbi:minor tail protein [Burkholderia phage vB_BceS_KL1]|jgi:hypothetical protein|uniref:Minor tail protein n=1 Tax=Burkholderia phage vB_BceS_KL1 TaxID=1132026 RepID=I6NQU2_9CAUD|nr:tail terminator [Burkholderia phage vB_BceS_KL1]AEX56100.1 minor tail protein [Burkholderia phage vB_BceS_KL1]
MTTTHSEARNEINALFNTAWNANAGALAGYVPNIEWQGKQPRETPDSSKYWARVSIQTVLEEQTTLSTCEGKPGQKRYTASGLVFVQLFCPKSIVGSFEIGGKLAEVAKKAFRGKTTPGKVWFRNVRINELDPEDLYYRYNVVTEFEYDELG